MPFYLTNIGDTEVISPGKFCPSDSIVKLISYFEATWQNNISPEFCFLDLIPFTSDMKNTLNDYAYSRKFNFDGQDANQQVLAESTWYVSWYDLFI